MKHSGIGIDEKALQKVRAALGAGIGDVISFGENMRGTISGAGFYNGDFPDDMVIVEVDAGGEGSLCYELSFLERWNPRRSDESMPLMVSTAVKNANIARTIARAGVEKGLAAGAQVSEIESFFCWEGKQIHSPEWKVTFFTSEDKLGGLEELIRSRSEYEVPEIAAVKLDYASADFARWANASGQTGR